MSGPAETSPRQCTKCGKDNATRVCFRCRLSQYCSSNCQMSDSAKHKKGCVPENILGVVINCDGERGSGIFNAVSIGRSHGIHRRGTVAPVSNMVGHPLIVYRHTPWVFPGLLDPLLDNQIATYLMIKPSDGFAPHEWQNSVGTVTVMRKDGEPLTTDAIEAIWMYHDDLLELFSDGAEVAHERMNRESFEDFCENYRR